MSSAWDSREDSIPHAPQNKFSLIVLVWRESARGLTKLYIIRRKLPLIPVTTSAKYSK